MVATGRLGVTFAVLTPDQQVTPVEVTPTLYDELDARFAGFHGHALVAQYTFDADWPTWECHPAGEELVILIDGEATMLLRTPTGEQSVTLSEQGDYVVVPRDTWHTARVSDTARMLFITPGEGTRNAAEPGAD